MNKILILLASILIFSCDVSELTDKAKRKLKKGPTEKELAFEKEPYIEQDSEDNASFEGGSEDDINRDLEEESGLEDEQILAAEQARLAEEQRLAAEQARLAEEQRLAAEQARVAEEQRLAAEQARLAEEQRLAAEQARLAEEQRLAAEQARLAEEQRLAAEQARLAEEQRLAAEQARLAEEQRLAAEQARLAEEQRLSEEEREREETNTSSEEVSSVKTYSQRPDRGIYGDQTGFNKLLEEFGDKLPDGRNLVLGMFEAKRDNKWAVGGLAKSVLDTEVDYGAHTVPKGFSSHANPVARRLAGFDSHIPKVKKLYSRPSGGFSYAMKRYYDFENGGFLPPRFLPDIWNNSWISGMGIGVESTYLSIDHHSEDYNILFVMGLSNNSGFPLLLAQTYNGIVVGRTNGRHSEGDARLYTPGTGERIKPDICGVNDWTSYGTPTVASAAGLIKSKAKDTEELKNATKVVAIKSILFAGATKEDVKTWSRTTKKPIDLHYGHGALNSYNSYKILLEGEQESSESSFRKNIGWDYGEVKTLQKKEYHFKVESSERKEFSASLSWNRKLRVKAGVSADILKYKFEYAREGYMANLSLRLYKINETNQRELVQESLSDDDNLEHIYVKELDPGHYMLEVESSDLDWDYGLSWRYGLLTK